MPIIECARGEHPVLDNAYEGIVDMTATVPEKVLEAMKEKEPLNRLGYPADVAAAYLFLASDEAAFVTGQVLGVDGGLVL